MYGHAVAELERRGVAVDEAVRANATAGLRFLLEARDATRSTGLITIVHPWESGADDSPRWDDWRGDHGLDPQQWFDTKGRLLHTVVRSTSGAPLTQPGVRAAPAGFNALAAFNAWELASVTGDDALRAAGDALAQALANRWRPALGHVGRRWCRRPRHPDRSECWTRCYPRWWIPAGPRPYFGATLDDHEYGGACGPAGVHRDEPSFAPDTYWRGPAWPQLTYLLWVAARRWSLDDLAGRSRRRARRGRASFRLGGVLGSGLGRRARRPPPRLGDARCDRQWAAPVNQSVAA